jgi:hypothetical protein
VSVEDEVPSHPPAQVAGNHVGVTRTSRDNELKSKSLVPGRPPDYEPVPSKPAFGALAPRDLFEENEERAMLRRERAWQRWQRALSTMGEELASAARGQLGQGTVAELEAASREWRAAELEMEGIVHETLKGHRRGP